MKNLFDLRLKNAVIVGGCGHLATAIGNGFAEAGANVVVLGRNPEKCIDRAAEIVEFGVKSIGIPCDATSKPELESALEKITKEFGSVDILVNIAGTTRAREFMDITREDYLGVMDSQVWATLVACQVFGQSMLAAGHGSIINISSLTAVLPFPLVLPYSVGKAGTDMVTRALANEWGGRGVRVNAILPGVFPSGLNNTLLYKADGSLTPRAQAFIARTPMGRFGVAKELVGIALYFASDDASGFTTGSVMPVDGGFLVNPGLPLTMAASLGIE